MSFDDFIQKYYPEAFEKYQLQERLDNKPETLIGVDVIAIRSGFSCGSEGGTNMRIESISDRYVHFVPNEKTSTHRREIGWSCDSDQFINSVKLADPDLAAVQFYQPQPLI